MSPASIAMEAAELAARRIGQEFRRTTEWKQDEPYQAFKYHQRMVQLLPRWRWIARGHHKRLERVWRARWESSNDADRCRAAEAMSR